MGFSGPLRTLLLAGIASIVVTACSSTGSEPEDGVSDAVVDGRYCGMLTTELAEEVLGTDDLRVEGDDLGADSRTQVLDCTIDVRSDGVQRIQLRVNLDDDSDYLRTTAPPECADLAVPEGWVSGWSCWSEGNTAGEGSLTSYAQPTEGRTLRITHSTADEGKAAAEDAAPRMLTDLNEAVEALG